MAQAEKDHKILLEGDKVTSKLLEGARRMYAAVSTTFGPKGRNVLLEKPFGRPLLTRDGVTVARDTYFKERDINMGAQFLLEASETTNRIAGDGTSGTVILGYHLFRRGLQSIAAGIHPMDVKQQLLDDSYIILEDLDKIGKPTKKSQLKEVATVSSGDPLLGQLIADAIERVGADGGIITEKSHVADVEREYVDGYFLQVGFEALQAGKKEIIKPHVVVCTRRLTSAPDAVELLNSLAEVVGVKRLPDGRMNKIPQFLLVGNIEEGAYQTIINTINSGAIDAIVLKTPPQFGNMSKLLLEDIAIFSGCTPIDDIVNFQDIDIEFVGELDRVVANKSEATLFSDNFTEDIRDRVQDLKDEVDAEPVDAIAEKLRDRIAKLEGKIALFRIGGATDSAKEEKEFRIEDAIQATRAAYQYGVVPGGAVTLLELSKSKISPLYREALRDVFTQLLKNANLPDQLFLERALTAPKGHGFNLKESEETVDMVKSGILDPKLVIEQVIINATEVAANALTIGLAEIFEDSK